MKNAKKKKKKKERRTSKTIPETTLIFVRRVTVCNYGKSVDESQKTVYITLTTRSFLKHESPEAEFRRVEEPLMKVTLI